MILCYFAKSLHPRFGRDAKPPNGNHHRVAAKVVSRIEQGRPATSVHGFVLAVFRARARARSSMRLYHSVMVDALLGREFGHGLANGDKAHDPRVGERRFMGRNGSRVDALHAKRSITSTSTVRHGGLSTSTMGSCGRNAPGPRLACPTGNQASRANRNLLPLPHKAARVVNWGWWRSAS